MQRLSLEAGPAADRERSRLPRRTLARWKATRRLPSHIMQVDYLPAEWLKFRRHSILDVEYFAEP